MSAPQSQPADPKTEAAVNKAAFISCIFAGLLCAVIAYVQTQKPYLSLLYLFGVLCLTIAPNLGGLTILADFYKKKENLRHWFAAPYILITGSVYGLALFSLMSVCAVLGTFLGIFIFGFIGGSD